jgi:hypothetical protein
LLRRNMILHCSITPLGEGVIGGAREKLRAII